MASSETSHLCLISRVIGAFRFDLEGAELVAELHIVLGSQVSTSDFDELRAMPNGVELSTCTEATAFEIGTAVNMPEVIQKVQTHLVNVSNICSWERPRARMLFKHGERDDGCEQQRSPNFRSSRSHGTKVEKFHAQLFEANIEKKVFRKLVVSSTIDGIE